MQGAQNIEPVEIAIWIFAGGECLRLAARLTARHIGEKLEQAVGRGAQRTVLDQFVAQALAANGRIRTRAKQSDDGIGKTWIVTWINAEGVARYIGKTAAGEIELDMIGLFLGRAFVKAAARQKTHLGGIVARGASIG